MRILIFLLALAIGVGDDGSKSGRKGNELYRNAEHEKAASLFSSGIAEQNTTEPGMVHSGLWNNLGASLHRMGRYDEARQAFGNAVSLAPSNMEIARSSYNAGNNAFEAYQKASEQQMGGMAPPAAPQPGQQPGQPDQQGPAPEPEGLQGALEHYKRAMLADPQNEDAKFNYEFVKRQLDEQQQNQDQQQQQDQENQDQENNENQDQQQQNQDQQNQEQSEDQQQQQQNQDSQQQEENQEQQQQQQNEQQQQQQPPPDPNKLSKEEAERILQALQNEEEELLRQVMKSQSRPKKVEKDW